MGQGNQSSLNILQPTLITPMVLGGEIDDETRINQASIIINEHGSRTKFACIANFFVGLEVSFVLLFELQRDSSAHHPSTVDRVDQSFDICFQNIT
jgi:hypothetical protein